MPQWHGQPSDHPKSNSEKKAQKARKRKAKRLPWIMSREECAALKAMPNIRYPTALRNRAMLEVMHRAGLRVSEVCNLRRRDIVWDRAQIEVRNAKFNKDRTVTTDRATMAWLAAWDSRRPRGKTFFTTLAGGPVSVSYIEQMVRRMANRAVRKGKIDADRAGRITPHKLRHAHATELIEEGVPLTAIQQQLGHANIAATSVYLHARPEGLRAHMASRTADLPPAPAAEEIVRDATAQFKQELIDAANAARKGSEGN